MKRIELRIAESTRYPGKPSIRLVEEGTATRSPAGALREALADAGFAIGDRAAIVPSVDASPPSEAAPGEAKETTATIELQEIFVWLHELKEAFRGAGFSEDETFTISEAQGKILRTQFAFEAVTAERDELRAQAAELERKLDAMPADVGTGL